jgi:flavin reductase (DIM6/NTAB) family NADH-FMN oxidoreductase RutF
MGRWATGVSVVTAHHGTADAGLTVNALLSVALQPPSLLVSLTRDADTVPVLEASGAFGVSFLAADQRQLSERFASTLPPPEKFRDVPFHRGALGVALLDGALGWAECRVVARTERYDHLLFVGEVARQALGRDVDPLLFYRSGYAETVGDGRLRLPGSGGPDAPPAPPR